MFQRTGASFIEFDQPAFEQSVLRQSIRISTSLAEDDPFGRPGQIKDSFFNMASTLPTAADTYVSVTDTASSDTLTFYNTVYADRATANPNYQFRFTNFAKWAQPSSGRFAMATYGLLAAEIPRTGAMTYASRVEALDISAADSLSSLLVADYQSMSLVSCNYETLSVDFNLVLPVRDSSGVVSSAQFSARGFLLALGTGGVARSNSISGTISGNGMTGTFTGNLYGPQREEIGIAFAISGTSNNREARLIGTVIGR